METNSPEPVNSAAAFALVMVMLLVVAFIWMIELGITNWYSTSLPVYQSASWLDRLSLWPGVYLANEFITLFKSNDLVEIQKAALAGIFNLVVFAALLQTGLHLINIVFKFITAKYVAYSKTRRGNK